jgi:photosystem II stability/assembly factor-like uncharacterized protein
MALAVTAALAPALRAGDVRHFEDAVLHAVQFIDREEGWAVGDEGVVWHTIDGGREWERQETLVRASLRSVHFLNPYVGWIAGRQELPGGGSAGVLLYTKDGGVKWNQLLADTLPGLNRIRFLNGREGFVLGDGSEQYPTGLFRTGDSGRNWTPVKGARCPGWQAADFQDGQRGALVGPWGRLAKLRDQALGTADVEALAGRTLHGVRLRDNRALAVGQGGAVLFSTTSGARWGFADLKLPADVRAGLDFHDIHWAGNQVWVVGRPGSVLLHSHDGGASWELVPTKHALPLNGVFFLNEMQGWAVGALGSILATSDGGKTWKVQQHGGSRAAVLFVHARPDGIPLDTAAILGGSDGYLAAALRVTAPDPNSAAPEQAAAATRLAAALRQAGGAAGEMLWQFPMPRHLADAGKEELLGYWNRLHGNRADREILRQLVLALRIWRPDVVITDHPDARASGSAADAVVAEALHEAFTRAADPGAFPEQIERLRLQPWRVSKVYARWGSRAGAEVVFDLTAASPRLQTTPRDFAAPAAALLAGRSAPPPAERYFHLLDSRLPNAAGQRGLMDGIQPAVGVARRPLHPAAELAPAVVKAVKARRSLQTLTEAPAGPLSDPSRTLSQIAPALAAMPDNQAVAAALAVANRYAEQGQWVLAREVFLLLVDRYPAHPRAVEAYRWLIRHNSSSEARRRQELGQFLVLTQTSLSQPAEPLRLTGSTEEDRKALARPRGLAEERQTLLLGSQEETRRWFKGSLSIGDRLAAFGPLYAGDPSIQFCLQAARRQLGEFEAARQWYAHFQSTHSDGPWREAAAAELWLVNRVGSPPRPVASCRQTAVRPFLDGRLDDPCWQGLRPLVLRNAVGDTVKDYPTEVRLAYDQDFLYLAVRCRHPADRYVPPVKVRQRDADLRPYDRVSLLLDLDRDYSTCFQLQVDQRGCVFEDCWGDRSWNPRWFVALRSDRTGWQVEAAIPMAELTGDRVPLGSAWACNVVRILPGRGVQGWSVPADVEPRPEGMGLLLFTQDAAQATAPMPRVP